MNGEEMNSASFLMNLAPAAAAAPATSGAEQAPARTKGFDQALASAQADSGVDDANGSGVESAEDQPVSTELASSLIVRGAMPAGQCGARPVNAADDEFEGSSDVAEDAATSGAAAVLAQMLAGSSPLSDAGSPPVADASTQAITLQTAASLPKGVKPGAEAAAGSENTDEASSSATGENSGKASGAFAATLDAVAVDSRTATSAALQEKSFELSPSGAQPPQSSSQVGSSAQTVVQAAATALRDVAPAAASSAPVHATLREPVGTARWADELGNHLVMMSVRGQQQGSLTLTPEHLGPVEVQISMNRDTANVWFGAQHADTRTALAEAMPRLRELLASSGLSLGQSGVSEQAPRENPVSPPSLPGGGSRGIDADAVVEKSAPVWRVWRPGLIDTYA